MTINNPQRDMLVLDRVVGTEVIEINHAVVFGMFNELEITKKLLLQHKTEAHRPQAAASSSSHAVPRKRHVSCLSNPYAVKRSAVRGAELGDEDDV